MPFIKLIVPLGLIVFGVVAAFMGFVVLVTSLQSGEINVGSSVAGQVVSEITRAAADPGAYWRKVALFGGAPLVLGAAAAMFGWRRLGR